MCPCQVVEWPQSPVTAQTTLTLNGQVYIERVDLKNSDEEKTE